LKTRKKEILAAAVSVLLLLAALALATRVLTPKRHDMGSTWGQFLQEKRNSTDLLFFGSSLAYCDVAPAAIWEESGLRSYVMAGAEQTIPISYYYLREALRTQTPRAVFVEVTGVIYKRHTSFTKVNIGYMPWGENRLQASLHETEDGLLPGLLFPLYFYHSRWNELTADDFRTGLLGYRADDLVGYTCLHEYVPMEGPETRSYEPDEKNYNRNLNYLTKIASLCRERGIQAVFYLAPTVGQLPADVVDDLRAKVAGMDGALFWDGNEDYDDLGIDPTRDYYDKFHFNVSGAEKFSRYLADWTKRNLSLTPTGEDSALWQKRADALRTKAAEPLTRREEGKK